jgi:hypothetical protein
LIMMAHCSLAMAEPGDVTLGRPDDREAWRCVHTARELLQQFRQTREDLGRVHMTEIQVCGIEALLFQRAGEADAAYETALHGGKLIMEQHVNGSTTESTAIVGCAIIMMCGVAATPHALDCPT